MTSLQSSLLLLLAAVIWGFAFVAQRIGMEFIGPFSFNGVRFLLGGFSLIPLIVYFNGKSSRNASPARHKWKPAVLPGVVAGGVLFMAASLQQMGLLYTTAGKAAFVTCLYIVIVPVMGLFLRHRLGLVHWIAAFTALIGLYFLCVKEGLSLSYGDFLEFIGAFLWAVHILLIDYYVKEVDALRLAFLQFMMCGLLSLGVASVLEDFSPAGLWQALIPILYGGLCSVGVAYTLQIVGQKNVQPSHASIILSMETVFAALGGFLILNETLGLREIVGSVLMLTGMLLPQLCSARAVLSKEGLE
jgi:drug/metabolite transporter (DMT)-like permease